MRSTLRLMLEVDGRTKRGGENRLRHTCFRRSPRPIELTPGESRMRRSQESTTADSPESDAAIIAKLMKAAPLDIARNAAVMGMGADGQIPHEGRTYLDTAPWQW